MLSELSEIAGTNNNEETATPNENEVVLPKSPEQIVSAPILPTTTLSTVDLIKSRIEMYKLSEKNATELGDNGRARSRARGIKSLEMMLIDALRGRTINPDDIPPIVSTKLPNVPDAPTATASDPQTASQNLPKNIQPQSDPTPKSTTESPTESELAKPITASANEQTINALLNRQREYKMAALASKKSGDTATALQYVKIIKIFDTVLASARNGDAVDLSDVCARFYKVIF